MYELIIIGGGPAGLAAAVSAYENGLKKIALIERDCELGGILNQCIHNGFGLHHFKTELTGPEYAERFIHMLKSTDVQVFLNMMVLEITAKKEVYAVSKENGFTVLSAKSLILAMGCRERTRGAIAIPGTRPAGIFTAGTAQRYLNIEGYLVGKRAVILGSGDIGLIMARRLTLEGAHVLACVELMPYSNGLNRNIVQCLHDYNIPLYLSHTVTNIQGEKRLERVTVCKVDENRQPIAGSEIYFDCDTLLLSVGLIPENELTKKCRIHMDSKTNGAIVFENRETSVPGIFACGNAVHVHDLVDFVSAESITAGKSAALYVLDNAQKHKNQTDFDSPTTSIELVAQSPVSYTVPQKIHTDTQEKTIEVFFRVNKVLHNTVICVKNKEQILAEFKREHMTPGEMERIVIPMESIKNAQADTVTITVQEVQK